MVLKDFKEKEELDQQRKLSLNNTYRYPRTVVDYLRRHASHQKPLGSGETASPQDKSLIPAVPNLLKDALGHIGRIGDRLLLDLLRADAFFKQHFSCLSKKWFQLRPAVDKPFFQYAIPGRLLFIGKYMSVIPKRRRRIGEDMKKGYHYFAVA